MKKNSQINEMIEVNVKQKDYYEFDPKEEFKHGGNAFTRIWDKIRAYQYKMTDDLDMNNLLFDIHKEWIGPLKGKKVLDLGCHSGNELSEYLAGNSAEYHGIDLSSSALSVLEDKFKKCGITNAHFHDKDILSDDFQEKDFDIIYAKAVFHHFRYFDEFLKHIKSKLKKGGIIVTIDPMNTFLPLRFIRFAYRTIQFDKDWEYPFTRKSIDLISNNFKIEQLAGIMGKSKYGFPLYFISKNIALRKSKKWMNSDLHDTKFSSSSMWGCLRISFLLRKQ